MACDVAVVGAGPIGLAAARVAAEAGARTTVFEKRREGTALSSCTGLVSRRTLPALGVTDRAVLREIRAVRVHFPGGGRMDLRSRDVKAVVIDRAQLESELLLKAQEAGVRVRYATAAVYAEPGALKVESGSSVRTMSTSIIVGADGPRSAVAEWFSLARPSDVVAAAQVEIEAPWSEPDRVDIYVGEESAPGFFGWCVPAQDRVLRVGLGVMPPHQPGAFLDKLLSVRFPGCRILSRSAGWIPVALAPKTATRGVILVGDAAGHVKPLTGGGLYTGALCARIAGLTAAQASLGARASLGGWMADSEKQALDPLEMYPTRCIEAVGRELSFGRSVRYHLSRLKDTDVQAVTATLGDPALLQTIADGADIDHLHRLPDLLAAEPRLWTAVLRVIPLLGCPAAPPNRDA